MGIRMKLRRKIPSRTNNPHNWEEKERTTMEYLTGVTKKEALEISEILAGDYEGRQIKVRELTRATSVHRMDLNFVSIRSKSFLNRQRQCRFRYPSTS